MSLYRFAWLDLCGLLFSSNFMRGILEPNQSIEPLKVLHVEDNPLDAELVEQTLLSGGIHCEITRVDKRGPYIDALQQQKFDLILADFSLPSFDGRTALSIAQEMAPHVPFLLVSGALGEEIAIENLKSGATDYVLKSRLSRLVPSVKRALREAIERNERRNVERQLIEAEIRYRTLVEKVPAIVYRAEGGRNGKWLYVSPQIETILGFSPDEWVNDPQLWLKQLHPDDRERVLAEEERVLNPVGPLDCEYRLFTRNGELLWFHDEAVVFPVNSGNEGGFHMHGVLINVTKMKESEEARHKLELQLRQSQKMEAIGELAGGVAHDFNNILMAISGCSELLELKMPPGSPGLKEVREIRKAADQAAALTRQLLAFSRRQILEMKILDLNKVVAGIEPMLLRLIGERIELLIQPGNDLAQVKADSGQVEQIILNLAVNARDAMRQGGKLTINTSNVHLKPGNEFPFPITPGPYVLLTVSDDGSGMDEATRLRVFEPFFTTKEEGKGTGLGLSTVYGIVKQSGGYILCQSEIGQGTTFRIYFPAVSPAPVLEEAASFVKEIPLVGSETILIVDDNNSVRTAIGALLEMHGYKVMLASNGEEAIKLAQELQTPLHLLITDMVMPQMTGPELAEHLSSSHPSVKILFMTGYSREAVQKEYKNTRDFPFVQKPVPMNVLLKKVREVLQGS